MQSGCSQSSAQAAGPPKAGCTAERDMPWKCPACVTAIRHAPIDATPRPGVIYRCSVCRLEFVLDKVTQKLTLAPLPSTEPPIRPKPVTPE